MNYETKDISIRDSLLEIAKSELEKCNKENKIITCPNCSKTGNYKIKPNYCCYCGHHLKETQNK